MTGKTIGTGPATAIALLAAGKRVARTLIVAAAAINLFMAGPFWFVVRFQLVAESGPQSELFAQVLDLVWRIEATLTR